MYFGKLMSSSKQREQNFIKKVELAKKNLCGNVNANFSQ